MAARRQLAEQQQELDRIRQETYILKEAHQAEDSDQLLQNQLADVQNTANAYNQQLGASHKQCELLHQQLIGSQQQVLSLTDQVKDLQQQAETQSRSMHQLQNQPAQKVLDHVSHGHSDLLVDKAGGHACAAGPAGLQHVRTWSAQRGVQLSHPAYKSAGGLALLHRAAWQQQAQLQHLFQAHSQGSNGSTSAQLLPNLLSCLLPTASTDELHDIQALLAADDRATLTAADFLAAVEACVKVNDAVSAAEAAVPQELRLLSAALQQQQAQLCETFEAQAGGSGRLSIQQLTQILRQVTGSISTDQLQHLLAKLHAQGVHGSISLQDLLMALQLQSAPKLPSATHLRSSPTASPRAGAKAAGPSAELHAVRKQLAQATQAAQHQAQACSNKDAELIMLQRAVKQLQRDVQLAKQQQAASAATHAAQQGTEVLEAQIRAAGDKAHVLKTRFLETKSGFEHLKMQHARVVQARG